tara:strand:+ start:33 stop:215 length:183 start_codon:yes stop_codon:yes gene_type:complete
MQTLICERIATKESMEKRHVASGTTKGRESNRCEYKSNPAWGKNQASEQIAIYELAASYG